MKRILSLVTASLLFVMMASAQAELSATEQLKQACTKAGKENKKVFLMFHASWCGWCHRMDNSMNDEECKKYFDDNFVIIHFVVDESPDKKNLETPGAAELRTQYGGDGQGIPFWVIFDKEGNILGDSMKPEPGSGNKMNIGCPAQDTEVDYFIDLLKKTTRLKEDQLEKIGKRFRKNKS
ncbi:MAG: thioredoxin family protein [Chitinophagaceae bacterium]